MKRMLTFILISTVVSFVDAQNPISVMTNEVTVGTNFITNTEIRTKEFIFPENIYNAYFDTTHKVLTVQLRGFFEKKIPNDYGKIVQYDVSDNSIKWEKEINYKTTSILQCRDVIIQSKLYTSVRLNAETGKKQWKINRQSFYLDEKTNMGLGFLPSNNSSNLEGFMLSDGSVKWHRAVNREYGINEIVNLNDSAILLNAGGLHSVDLKNGLGWDYTAITGSKDYTALIAVNAVGIIIGAFTGYYMYTTDIDIATNICSGVWMDSTGYYFASRDKLSLLSLAGQPLWTSELPKKKTSKSDIFLQDSLIYMVNYGFGHRGDYPVYVGNPFIAAFEKDNGSQVFMQEVSDKKEMICDYITGNNMIICLYKDKIAGYLMQDGSLNIEKKLELKKSEYLKNFAVDQFYTETDSGLYPVNMIESGNIHVVTDNMLMLTMNDQFEVTKTTDIKEFFILLLSTDQLKFLWKENKVIVINPENRKVAEFSASLQSILVGNKLYDTQGRKFAMIDLSGLIMK
jgi:PQQ-like domain